MVGDRLGDRDGATDGSEVVGETVGEVDGELDGEIDGAVDGEIDGEDVGDVDGEIDGDTVGASNGHSTMQQDRAQMSQTSWLMPPPSRMDSRTPFSATSFAQVCPGVVNADSRSWYWSHWQILVSGLSEPTSQPTAVVARIVPNPAADRAGIDDPLIAVLASYTAVEVGPPEVSCLSGTV